MLPCRQEELRSRADIEVVNMSYHQWSLAYHMSIGVGIMLGEDRVVIARVEAENSRRCSGQIPTDSRPHMCRMTVGILRDFATIYSMLINAALRPSVYHPCDYEPTIGTDINECKTRPCSHGGTCDNTPGSFTCDCTGTGYTGETCDEPTADLPEHYDCLGNVDTIGDGYYDIQNNAETCGFDGGDCCASTCVSSTYTCGGYVHVNADQSQVENFNFLNPAACENSAEGCPVCAPGCMPDEIGDGVCNPECWVAACGWDFAAVDAPDCTCADVNHHEDCDGLCFDDSYLTWEGDGYCDDGQYGINLVCAAWNNDAGDCDGDEPWEPPVCEGYMMEVGDGWCDDYNNNEGCDYDGGDCCQSECFGNTYPCPYDAAAYDCQDPWALENDGGFECDSSQCNPSWIGDGECDTNCWFPECGWDANAEGVSDCSCEDLNDSIAEEGFEYAGDCNGTCHYQFFTNNWLGDGYCDEGEYGLDLNCEAFNFDAGDCAASMPEDEE